MRLSWGPFLFGAGIMAFLDGVILHQILQWHSVYMHTTRPGQIFSDGLFHLFAIAIIIISGILIWKENPGDRRAGKYKFWGSFFLGAGTFNLLEGLIDHHLLGIHHVREGSPNILLYDLGFDLISVIILLIGWVIFRKGRTV